MKWFCLFVTGAFCVLASYSYGTIQPYPARHYTAAKPVILYRTDKAALIASLWGITPEELSRPIDIFGDARRDVRK